MKHIIASPLAAIALLAWPAQASAELLFNFDSAHPLNSPVVSGYKQNFITTTEQARGGSGSSLKFAHNQPDPYASFTYDVPFDTFTSGIITVWFYDARGSFNTGHGPAKSGGAIILEDKSHPADFVAVEALSYPYGKGGQPAYYGSEGIIDRLATGDRFDSASFPNRTMGFHKVEFHVSAAQTLVYVDGLPSAEVAGPGSGAALRLRFMADSPSNGGSQTDNWITAPNATSAYLGTPWLYFDDISFNRELPSAAVATQDFEIVAGSPEYDAAGVPASPGGPGYPPQNNPHMDGFVNQWDVTTTSTFVRSGEQAAYFANHTPPLRSIAFDLAEAPPGTTVTLWFYDAKGQDEAMDHDNSIIIESGNNPAEFLAVEINNWPYPYGGGTKNYYLTESDGVSSTDFYSLALPARTLGWHKVEIGLYETYSQIAVDGQLGLRRGSGQPNNTQIATGPGTDKSPKLRLLADGASQGGYGNWTTTDPLTASYRVSTEPYVYYDDISLPIPANAAVDEWSIY